MSFEYEFDSNGNIINKYQDYNAPDVAYPPYHFGQQWETFDANDWKTEDQLSYKYQDEWHSVYTITLGELYINGVFDWSRPELDWSFAAFDDEQYNRICEYFLLRFKWREISMLPVLKWFDYLKRKLVFELMPKYTPLYKRVAEGINPLSSENEYYKDRTIQSAYPETLLSENADYITDGKDQEYQRIKEHGITEAITNFAEIYRGVDELLLDELETMFISMYTCNTNVW